MDTYRIGFYVELEGRGVDATDAMHRMEQAYCLDEGTVRFSENPAPRTGGVMIRVRRVSTLMAKQVDEPAGEERQ